MNIMNRQTLIKKFNQYQHAVYFSSADHQHCYFGFGKQDEMISNSIDELQKWQKRQNVPVFGGIPFDKQNLADSKLMNGYFIAPQYVIDEKTGESWGTLPATDNQESDTQTNYIISKSNEEDWITRTEISLQEMLNDQQKQKVVLGMQQTLQLAAPLNLSKLITSLIKYQPNSYHIIIKHHDEVFVSATPERLIQLHQMNIKTAAVAGTIKRATNPQIDQQLAQSLQHDAKNLHEHQLVVHEITNKIASLADLTYHKTPQILKTPQVQHLYTPITGTLKHHANLLQLVEALHPTPALGGLPLKWALKQIQRTELNPRGLFAAPVGYVLPNGDGEFVIGIRSLWEKQRTIKLFAGAGILAESNLAQEAHEIELKMSVMEAIIKEQTHE